LKHVCNYVFNYSNYPCVVTSFCVLNVPHSQHCHFSSTDKTAVFQRCGRKQFKKDVKCFTVFSHFSQNYEKWLLASLCLSVRSHGTPRLPFDGFSWGLIIERFSKICWANSSSIKIWKDQLVLYIYTNTHLWSYFAQFFLEWEMFQTKVVDQFVNQTTPFVSC
jgi:hypothetical protein